MWELASPLWAHPEESSRPGPVRKAGGSERELADMCYFFGGGGEGLDGVGYQSFTLSNLCCLKEKKKLFPEPVRRLLMCFSQCLTYSLNVIPINIVRQVM